VLHIISVASMVKGSALDQTVNRLVLYSVQLSSRQRSKLAADIVVPDNPDLAN